MIIKYPCPSARFALNHPIPTPNCGSSCRRRTHLRAPVRCKNDRIKKIVRNKISETFFPSTFWPPPSRVRTLKVLFGTERPKARTFLHWLMSFYFLIPGLVPKEKKTLINHETVWPRKSGVSLVVFLHFLVQKSFFWCLHGKHCRIITTNT